MELERPVFLPLLLAWALVRAVRAVRAPVHLPLARSMAAPVVLAEPVVMAAGRPGWWL